MKIWQNLFKQVAYKSYQIPKMVGLAKYRVDAKNGLLAEKGCENAVELLFIEGTQPQQESDCTGGSGSNWFLNLFN